jgi:hypothetical protein
VGKEMISAADQDRGRTQSRARLLASAERELSPFVAAVNELFDAELARQAADNWMEELERTDWPSDSPVIDWRRVTIAAAARLGGRDEGRLPGN